MSFVFGLNISDCFHDFRIEEWFTKKVQAETSRSILASFVNDLFKELEVHVFFAIFSGAIRAAKVAVCGRFDEDVAREIFVNVCLSSYFK